MYIYKGEIYLEKQHIQLIKNEPGYVRQRYHAVASVLSPKSTITRQNAAHTLKMQKRQFQQILQHFQSKGIPGLRHQSKRPHQSPERTLAWLEDIVVKVRDGTGFGSFHISQLVNISLRNQWRVERILPRTVSRILVRKDVIESERRAKKMA
jgi:hypothetical protein